MDTCINKIKIVAINMTKEANSLFSYRLIFNGISHRETVMDALVKRLSRTPNT